LWVIFALLDPDPDTDPGTPLNPDPVRIHNTGPRLRTITVTAGVITPLLFSCQVVKTVEPVVRPKGLGLGAAKPKQEVAAVPKEGEEKLELKKGAFIRVESGRKAGLYGEVEGFDEENAR
jgi:hypothetical protein